MKDCQNIEKLIAGKCAKGEIMKRLFMTVLATVLIKICDLVHCLNDKHEEALQMWFVDIIGYYCPFAMWSANINEKYGLSVWERPKASSAVTSRKNAAPPCRPPESPKPS